MGFPQSLTRTSCISASEDTKPNYFSFSVSHCCAEAAEPQRLTVLFSEAACNSLPPSGLASRVSSISKQHTQ